MAFLGTSSQKVQWIPGTTQAPTRGQPATPMPSTGMPAVIDGTPVRVAIIVLSAAAGLAALHMAGFRFNVGVSG